MGSFEIITMVVALIIMFGAVVAKMVTSQLINRMQNSISAVTQSRQKAMGQLKMAQSQKKVAEQNKIMLAKKKEKIEKKISRLKKELSGMKEEAESRQKTREAMRGKLVRPTIAAPHQEGGEE